MKEQIKRPVCERRGRGGLPRGGNSGCVHRNTRKPTSEALVCPERRCAVWESWGKMNSEPSGFTVYSKLLSGHPCALYEEHVYSIVPKQQLCQKSQQADRSERRRVYCKPALSGILVRSSAESNMGTLYIWSWSPGTTRWLILILGINWG